MVSCCLANFSSLTTGPGTSGYSTGLPKTGLLLAGILAAIFAYSVVNNQAHAAGQSNPLRLQRCFAEISQANQAFAEGRADIANERLLQLTHSCDKVAHLYHNLGAIAALRRDWEQAISYLEQSLAIDRRAAMTQAGLSGIYQYRAALAYRKALDLSGPLPKPPAISLQEGNLANGPVEHESAIAAIEGIAEGAATPEANAVRFEVASWWTARRETKPELPPWSAVSYSPDTLDNNLAMVLLGFNAQKLLLVLKKNRDHWTIIREKQL